MGGSVGAIVGAEVGSWLCDTEGLPEGITVGVRLGCELGLLIFCGTGIELGPGDAALGAILGDAVDIGRVSSVGASLGVVTVASLGFAVRLLVGSLESFSDGKDVGETLGSSFFVDRDCEGD